MQIKELLRALQVQTCSTMLPSTVRPTCPEARDWQMRNGWKTQERTCLECKSHTVSAGGVVGTPSCNKSLLHALAIQRNSFMGSLCGKRSGSCECGQCPAFWQEMSQCSKLKHYAWQCPPRGQSRVRRPHLVGGKLRRATVEARRKASRLHHKGNAIHVINMWIAGLYFVRGAASCEVVLL